MPIFHLTRQELRNLFHSPATYIAMTLALVVMGFFFYITLLTFTAEPQEELPLTVFFSVFWIPVLLIVPMLTMRSLAEERRFGTIETLLTAPIHPHQVVLAKFFAAYLFYLAVWLLFLVFPLLADQLLDQPDFHQRLFDRGAILGNYAFIALSGAFFVAIGIFTSSLTRSQLVAGMLSFSILFMLILGVAALQMVRLRSGDMDAILPDSLFAYVQIHEHFTDFGKGRLDSRPFIYYLSGTTAVLGLAIRVLEAKR